MMVGRIILTLVILIVGFMTIQVIEQKIAPDHTADLVMEQVENETSGAQIRVEQNAQNWYSSVIFLSIIGIIFWIWNKSIISFIRWMFNDYDDMYIKR